MSLSDLNLSGRTVIVTGGANGIGAQTIKHFHSLGANVVIADLPNAKTAAEELVSVLSSSKTSRAIFVPVNILKWNEIQNLFTTTTNNFGRVDILIANAGVMESKEFFDLDSDLDENGNLKEPTEAYKVVDVNLKGTMNTLRLAMHYMRKNTPDGNGSRGSIVLIASTSGYFGGTGVVSYVASKHGVVGLLRASQKAATQYGIRLNAVAPFFTPTHITGNYAQVWHERGLPANRVEDVAESIVRMATKEGVSGECYLVAGQREREIEKSRTALVGEWMGEYMTGLMAKGGKLFEELGGYPLPQPRP